MHVASQPGATRNQPRKRGRPGGGSTPLSAQQIIDAAITAIRTRGPLLSMDDIAAEAGVTKPIIYRTVGDKAKLASALADHLFDEVDRATVTETEHMRRSPETFRFATRVFFEILHRDRNLLMFVEHGWGAADGSQIDNFIERAAIAHLENFAATPAIDDQSGTRSRTWAIATVGALRTTARIWTLEPYCELDEVVDDIVTFVYQAHKL